VNKSGGPSVETAVILCQLLCHSRYGMKKIIEDEQKLNNFQSFSPLKVFDFMSNGTLATLSTLKSH
jgi:hypothetical protein